MNWKNFRKLKEIIILKQITNILGNDGSTLEMNPLFQEDILRPRDSENDESKESFIFAENTS